jgi:hypothetical protein
MHCNLREPFLIVVIKTDGSVRDDAIAANMDAELPLPAIIMNRFIF